ncbi:hypothetical protein ABZ260_50270 [Streptosporangium sp. NPDC006013]|uniref:hypothetical protein n=1 Tax=Streptosporangium sp. NPDC006013 TaxID=3155596 RepID=UPI0033A12193
MRGTPGSRPASRQDRLAEIRRFRAEVFYDQGRRPGFRIGDAEFDDPQDLDLDAFHLTAHVPDREELAACVRLAPPAQPPGSRSGTISAGRRTPGYAEATRVPL